jgi:peptide/nickel transport system substrate-binding protein
MKKWRAFWHLAGSLAVVLLLMGAVACGAAEEEEPDEVTSTDESMEEDDDSMAAEDTMAEETMEETDESMVAEEPEDVIEEGEYVAAPVVGEISIQSASEINEDNIFKARGISVWTDDPPNKNSVLRLRGNDYTTWDTDKRYPTAPERLMADTLVRYRADNPMEPWDLRSLPSLAESWEFVDDTTIRFALRQGVKFSDKPPVNGREMVADDVVYSFERRLRPGGRYGGPLGPLTSIIALDDYTVEFKFEEPFAPFMTVIGVTFYAIQPPEAEEEFGGLDDWEATIRTGPWYMESYDVGTQITQLRHEDYWRGPNGVTGEDYPYVEQIHGIVIPDEPAAIAAYRAGLLDAGPAWQIWGAWGALKDNMITWLDKPELLYNYHPAGGGAWTTYFYGPKLEGPWLNKKIRWGVAMYNDISFEAWAPCCGGVQPARWAALDNPWYVPTEELTPDGQQFYTNFPDNTLNLELAQQYIREGKIELGLDPDEPIKTTMSIRQPDTAILDIATRMVADLAKIGIEAEILGVDEAEFLSVQSGDYTGLALRYDATGSREPDTLFYNRYYSESEFNAGGVNDPYLDELILKGRRELDPTKRRVVYEDIQRHIAEMQYDWAVPNWTNENVFPEWVKNPGAFTAGIWIQDMYLSAWADHTHPSRTEWDWEK